MTSAKTDAEGFLLDINDWSKTFAEEAARHQKIELTEAHWEIIHLLREFYFEFDISPAMRILVKQTKLKLGDAKGSSHYLLTLFPGSPAKIASQIAGLPKPTNCL